MKQKVLPFLITVLMSMVGTKSFAHDIEVANSEGVMIYYAWINGGTELAVSYRGDNCDAYKNEYTGDVVIPKSVDYGEKTYNVTSIREDAFDSCKGLTSITLPSTLTSIGSSAFADCTGLNAVHISDLVAWCKVENRGLPLHHLFLNGTEIKDLIIPDGVTSLGYGAFRGSAVTSVTIPNSVTSIGNSAFMSCSSLATIISEIETPFAIEDYTFYDIYATAKLVVPAGKKSAYQATAGWKKFQNIIENVKVGSVFNYNGINYKVGENNTVAVTRTEDITGVILIPSQVVYNEVIYTVTSIEMSAFDKNHLDNTITKVVIPSTIKSIGIEAFVDLKGLTGVYISDLAAWCNISFVGTASNPLEYAHHLFLNDTEITDLIIPDDVKSISTRAFYGCSGLTSVTIPNGVTSIGGSAFKNCTGIKKVYSEIQKPFAISDDVFEGIYAEATLLVPIGTKSAYQSAEGWKNFKNIIENVKVGSVFEYNGIYYKVGENNTVAVTRNKDITGVILIPSQVVYNDVTYTVTSIEMSAFDKSHLDDTVTKVVIPSTIKSIGIEAFVDLKGLTGVYISDLAAWCDISFIGTASNPLEYAHHLFLNDTEITDLIIPDGVKSISTRAFYGCSGLTSVTIPNSVTNIGGSTFKNCTGIKNVYSEIQNPFAISDDAFEGIYTEATLTVPVGTKSAYQSAEGWKNFKNIVENVTVGSEFEDNGIRYKVGEDNTISVISKTGNYTGAVVIPSQVTYNGKTYTVTSISSSAFEGCVDMTAVTIPSTVTSIGDAAFYYCTALTIIDIPDGVTTIGEGAFSKCYGLVSVTIPASVTSIGENAFFQCYSITQINCGIENPFTINENVFPASVYTNAALLVPTGKKADYQKAEGWKKFQNIYYADGVYTLTYYVDGVEYKSVKYNHGAGITPEPEPAKEGYTFSGWSEIPESMPDHDVTVTGTFTANKYALTYKVDGEIYVTYQVEYGTPITPEPAPTREGYTFSGWSYIPEKMPAEAVNVVGSFTVNQYTITYVIDGETYTTVTVDFNSKIVPPTPPSKDGFDFAWEEYPETMPASDITINGSYTTTGILSIAVESGKAKIFTLDGRQVDTLQKGINIIRMDDGTTKKVVLGK